MSEQIERVVNNGFVMAIICKPGLINEKLSFVTPEDYPLQLGVNNRVSGEIVKAHRHKPFFNLNNLVCQEMYYVLQGSMAIDLFDDSNKLFRTVFIKSGDVIVLNCGHGIKFSENCKFFEIKQGPYRGRDLEKEMIG